MTKTELDELEQKYLLWRDTRTAQQILRLISEYRQLEKQLAAKSDLNAQCQNRASLKVEQQQGEPSTKTGTQNLALFGDE